MKPLQIPKFFTLNRRASWLNAAGGLDRSACVEVRVSELRRLAGCYRLEETRRGAAWRKAGQTKPLPGERPARNRHGRVSTGVITISARSLHELHRHRRPRRLAGDWRTPRANAMRREKWQPDPNSKGRKGFRCRITRRDPVAMPFDRGLEGNPNKGASREKMIGLHETWSQPIRVEKWVFPKRIQPAYYMICPGRLRLLAGAAPGKPPPLSTCGSGRKDPKTKECPQRCLKLLMVQCTPQENSDALAAQLWIESIPPNHLRHYREEVARLVNRYGPIMEPRVLLCPRCLGTRYGNNPETVRQGWRRRNRKDDTRRSKSIEPIVRARMAQVDPEECTPEAGQRDLREQELARYRRYNRRRQLVEEAVRMGQLPPEASKRRKAKKKPSGPRRKRKGRGSEVTAEDIMAHLRDPLRASTPQRLAQWASDIRAFQAKVNKEKEELRKMVAHREERESRER